MNKNFNIIASTLLLDDFLNVKAYKLRHDLYRGGQSETLRRLRLEKQAAVSILLYDARLNQVVMVEQFRIGAKESSDPWLLENPAGYMETGESPEDVARREVVEETGCQIGEVIPICDFFVSPGISNEKIHLLCADVDSSKAGGIYGLADEGEDIRVEVLTLNEAKAELYTGRINSTSTIMAIQWLLLNEQMLSERWGG